MGETPMPGGWSMSSVWAPMCGQTWLAAAAAFAQMWTVMMVTMMLPSSTPQWRRCWLACRMVRLAWPSLLAGTCYLSAWALAGTLVFCVGNALEIELPYAGALARAVPLSSGIALVVAGVAQCAASSRRRVKCRPAVRLDDLGPIRTIRAACQFGLRLALHEGYCCANLMAVVLAIGIMDWMAMAAATVAMTVERLVPADGRTARGVGAAIMAIGMLIVARAVATAFR
ncbi:DUF2182 domain-containing protein [Trinickia sp. NRRL B-1857]|uniref:copper chaperone n=1 Tax=Trinickia sp. NRRL B-1857 TaxID=3162879 RepID=UPI003D296EFC